MFISKVGTRKCELRFHKLSQFTPSTYESLIRSNIIGIPLSTVCSLSFTSYVLSKGRSIRYWYSVQIYNYCIYISYFLWNLTNNRNNKSGYFYIWVCCVIYIFMNTKKNFVRNMFQLRNGIDFVETQYILEITMIRYVLVMIQQFNTY